jgi:hypothetical protein
MRTIPELQEGTHRAKASGTLPNGKPVIVNADGTVSVVNLASSSQSVGSSTAFSVSSISWVSSTFDSSSNKVVIAYQDDGFPRGYAVVGTVSGASISFGTPVMFNSGASTYIACTFDSNSNKVVIAYRQSNTAGYSVVGTVSGTSISFGSTITFNSTSGCLFVGLTFDSSSNKAVAVWRDQEQGNDGYAAVGTVSGTSISWGTRVRFQTGSSSTNFLSAAFDSNANKVVIAYSNASNSSYGTAIVGTVSGTSISFGSATVYESSTVYDTSCVYDASAQKIVIAYVDAGNSSKGTAVVGTVSGTSISFGTPIYIGGGSGVTIGDTGPTGIAYDANAQKVIIAYEDESNNSYGTVVSGTVSGTSISFETPLVFANNSSGVVYTSATYDSFNQKVAVSYVNSNDSDGYGAVFSPAAQATNLTSENYIGMSQGGSVADGSSATVDIIGSLSTNQSGLTAGQQYYVQTDGTIGETADDPSVFAGTAISATSLVVKT